MSLTPQRLSEIAPPHDHSSLRGIEQEMSAAHVGHVLVSNLDDGRELGEVDLGGTQPAHLIAKAAALSPKSGGELYDYPLWFIADRPDESGQQGETNV